MHEIYPCILVILDYEDTKLGVWFLSPIKDW